jgi:hypothetical protein
MVELLSSGLRPAVGPAKGQVRQGPAKCRSSAGKNSLLLAILANPDSARTHGVGQRSDGMRPSRNTALVIGGWLGVVAALLHIA